MMMMNTDKWIKDDTKVVNKRSMESDIQRFYAGKTIFLTGSTGYMGKCLVEKLLRGCPDLKRIYVMVREKRGTSAEERIKDYFNDVLFSTIRKMYPDFISKISLIEGDLMHDGMALSEKAKNTLIEEVNIMFHNASNVKFNERVSTALKINVLGTKAMLDLAKQCKHMEGFLYVSTAYSHCYKKHIMEEAYASPADMKMVQDLIAADLAAPTGLNDAVLSDILDKYPNTYCFTKGIAEGLVNDASKHISFPCVVYRPSIVLSSWKEPLRGWCGNLNGPALLFIGYALGIVHAGCLNEKPLDFIPVDMSINSLLVSMWDAVKERRNENGAVVYNYGSSVEKPITILRMRDLCDPTILATPSIRMIWTNFAVTTKCVWYFAILHILFHFLPALIVDAYLLVTGKKMQALSAFKKATMTFMVLSYFSEGGWKIDISKMNKAIDRMSSIDCELFFCDVRKLDWNDYCSEYWNGLRVYFLKDPMSTVPAAQRKYRIIKTIHYTIKYTTMLLIAYVTLKFLGLL